MLDAATEKECLPGYFWEQKAAVRGHSSVT